jgi:hypothetical protein
MSGKNGKDGFRIRDGSGATRVSPSSFLVSRFSASAVGRLAQAPAAARPAALQWHLGTRDQKRETRNEERAQRRLALRLLYPGELTRKFYRQIAITQ